MTAETLAVDSLSAGQRGRTKDQQRLARRTDSLRTEVGRGAIKAPTGHGYGVLGDVDPDARRRLS